MSRAHPAFLHSVEEGSSEELSTSLEDLSPRLKKGHEEVFSFKPPTTADETALNNRLPNVSTFDWGRQSSVASSGTDDTGDLSRDSTTAEPIEGKKGGRRRSVFALSRRPSKLFFLSSYRSVIYSIPTKRGVYLILFLFPGTGLQVKRRASVAAGFRPKKKWEILRAAVLSGEYKEKFAEPEVLFLRPRSSSPLPARKQSIAHIVQNKEGFLTGEMTTAARRWAFVRALVMSGGLHKVMVRETREEKSALLYRDRRF